VGSLIGMGLQSIFPPNIQAIIFQAIGLGVTVLGIQMALKIPEGHLLVFLFSLILGGVFGESLRIDLWLESMGEQAKNRLQIGSAQFTEGLITAFLLFCVGSITIVGAIEEGIHGKRDLLIIKSTLDGISSIAFAATYGIGVLFSIFPMLVLQGGMTLAADYLQRIFTETVLAQLTATGGVLIVAIGIRLLKLGEITIENLLPALPIAVLGSWLLERLRAR